MQKNYILDESVLSFSPYSVFAFDDNNIFIAVNTIKQMEEHAMKGSGEIRANAREFGFIMDELAHEGSLARGIKLQNGGTLRVVESLPHESIYDVYRKIESQSGSIETILVTRNSFQRVISNIEFIKSESYKSESVVTNGDAYDGRCVLYVSSDEMKEYASKKVLTLKKGVEYYATKGDGTVLGKKYKLSVNEHVILCNSSDPSSTMLGIFDGKQVHTLRYYPSKDAAPVFGVSARNVGQVFALDALLAPAEEIPLVILKGPAGTAKTFLSGAAALAQTIDQYHGSNTYRKVLLSRPNVKMDDDVGYLKGDEIQKVMPALRGLTDNIDNLMANGNNSKDYEDTGSIDYLMAKKIIDLQAMAYMRGRSVCNQFIIIDETQNATIMQILSLITRVGDGTKIVILGDPDQIDHPYLDSRTNGLCYAAEKMRGSPLCRQITFTEDECTRSPLAREAIARLTPKGASL